MPQLVPQRPPPPDYYAANLRHLFGHVATHHERLLGAAERRLLAAFAAASVDAQRLYARLAARAGPWIRVSSIGYGEVGDVAQALAELMARRLVRADGQAPADELLARLTRAEAGALFPRVRAPTKAAWIDACVGRYPDAQIRARVAARHPCVALAEPQAFRACLVLFFGGDGQDLSTYVLQDLGVLRFERYQLDPSRGAFADRAELRRYLRCRLASFWSHRLDEVPGLAPVLLDALQDCAGGRTVQRARDRVLNRLGRWHERRGEADAALRCYAVSESHPARERSARLLRGRGDEAAVARLLAEMARDPRAPEEADFAARFGSRRRSTAPPVSWCALPAATPAAIERHALALLTSNGGRGWHLENLLPLGLAGLVFWDAVFAPVPGAFSHPFQLGPRDLFWPDFARARRCQIDAQVQALAAPGALAAAVRTTAASRRGIANRLVHWGAFTSALVDALLDAVPHDALAAIATHTIVNLHRARTGFPDLLMVYGRDAWELVEVKGPTDQLQPAQRVWIDTLQRQGLPVRVLRFRAADRT
ncbi:MAG: VRR-NUC domain-containing protein [Pseudomonadales bacterium]